MLFKKCFILLMLLSGIACAEEPDINKRYTFTRALELAQDNNRPMMIFVWSVYCKECEKLKVEIFSDEALKNKLSNNIILAWVDILNASNKDVLKHYQARATPTVIFTDIATDSYPEELLRTHSSKKEIFAVSLDEALNNSE